MQPYTHPIGLGRNKCLENTFYIFRGDPWTCIGHAHYNSQILICASPHHQSPLAWGHCLHRLRGIVNQVEQHLLDLHRVRADEGKRTR